MRSLTPEILKEASALIVLMRSATLSESKLSETFMQLRRLLPDPDFRIAGKIFASLGAPDASWGMVKLTPDEQRSFLRKAPGVFKPCNGAWGRSGCTNVHLASAMKSMLHPAIKAAAKNVASNAKKKKPA